jgi:hypothetical protein
MTVSTFGRGNASSGTRGVMAGGTPNPGINVIDYVTIASTGNALDFGDLTLARQAVIGTSNGSRGLFAGGFTPTQVNTIDYVTIASTGNALDFGDLTVARSYAAGTSGSHGGLQ